jgi:hypothetical protein
MAAGDFTVFEEFAADVAAEVHNLDSDVIKLALITSAVAPAAATSTSTPFSTYTQVSAGGNYTAGGDDISATYSEASGVGTLDGTDNTWSQHASNPTDARWAILYNDTATNDNAIGFFDLGATIDMTAGDLTVTFHASGILTITVS